jgi:hypothetical protein
MGNEVNDDSTDDFFISCASVSLSYLYVTILRKLAAVL